MTQAMGIRLLGPDPSRNAKFLVDIGLLTAGKYKGATDTGKRLGRALEHDQGTDAQRYWRESVQSNDKVAGLVTTVRIKGGMTEKDFAVHVLYVSGQSNNSGNKTGARCVTDILIAAGLLEDEGGKLVVASSPVPGAVEKADAVDSKAEAAPTLERQSPAADQNPIQPAQQIVQAMGAVPQIAINIQLQLPETDNAEVYEKLFKALKDNLFPAPTE